MWVLLFQPGIDEMQQAKQDLSQSFFLGKRCFHSIRGCHPGHHRRSAHLPQPGKWVKSASQPKSSAWFFSALFMVLLGAFLPGCCSGSKTNLLFHVSRNDSL
jgi:hypothetical protein